MFVNAGGGGGGGGLAVYPFCLCVELGEMASEKLSGRVQLEEYTFCLECSGSHAFSLSHL